MKSMVDYIKSDNEDSLNKFNTLEKEILKEQSPNVWNINTDGNMEIKMEVDFEKFIFSIAEHTNIKVRELTTFKFYALLDYLKDKKNKNGRSDNSIQ